MKTSILVVAGILVVVAYIAAGPYLTLLDIKTGVIEKDSEKLADNIEFSTLRQNIKDQLNAKMMEKAATKIKDNPLAALAAGFATKMVDGMVDSFVTPNGLARVMGGKSLAKPSATDTEASDKPPTKDDLFKNARYAYDSINQFSIWVPNQKGEEVRFILTRDILSWKLTNFVIPMNKNPSSSDKL